MEKRPLVLIHGYSADEKAFHPLRDMLMNQHHVELNFLNICTYVSLNNEITIKDIAEGLDRAFRYDARLNTNYNMQTCEFDAIVHSTGMLVLRSWLANCRSTDRSANSRLRRLKHLVGLAPATWGSPQAHKGRTWLGALVKGNKQLGPDFLNAGDAVLDGLELGSKFTWDLAHIDLLGKDPFFGKGTDTPYVCVFIGNTPYTGLDSVANEPGTDGTVRWSGCGLNTRKITIDLTRFPTDEHHNPIQRRLTISDWANDRLDIPIIAVGGRSHSSILSDPDAAMVKLLVDFLNVGQIDDNNQPVTYETWLTKAAEYGEKGKTEMLVNPGAGSSEVSEKVRSWIGHLFGKNPDAPLEGWQQFVVHAIDERGDGVSDYMLEVLRPDEDGKYVPVPEMYTDVHAYRADPSYRCFHIRLQQGIISSQDASLKIRVHASSGTALVGYQGYTDKPAPAPAPAPPAGEGQPMNADAVPVILDMRDLRNENASLFYPFTTTLIELRLSREPIPLAQVSEVLQFI